MCLFFVKFLYAHIEDIRIVDDVSHETAMPVICAICNGQPNIWTVLRLFTVHNLPEPQPALRLLFVCTHSILQDTGHASMN